jgi:rod shape-determining protein MreD
MVQDSLGVLLGYFVAVTLQVLLFDHIHLFGFSCPSVYLFFIISYRFDRSQFFLILLGFLLGFVLDIMQSSSGANTIATLLISFIRPWVIRFSFGIIPDSNSLLSMKSRMGNQALYISLMILIHQFVLQSVAYFDVAHTTLILRNTLVNTALTFIILLATLNLTKKKN